MPIWLLIVSLTSTVKVSVGVTAERSVRGAGRKSGEREQGMTEYGGAGVRGTLHSQALNASVCVCVVVNFECPVII